jgi:hypothetical protein
VLSKEIRALTWGDHDVMLLKTVLGIGYYIALLYKASVGDEGCFILRITLLAMGAVSN